MKLSNFKKYAGPAITRRAEEYLAQGRVRRIEGETYADEGVYSYVVHGTEDYHVYITTDGDEIDSTSCDCPYGGMCKHVTAALMDMRNRVEASDAVDKKMKAMPEAQGADEESLMFTLCYLAFCGSDSFPQNLVKYPFSPAFKLSRKDFDGLGLLRKWIDD